MRRIDAFADYLRHERRCSPHTLTAYVNDIEQFFAFIKSAYDLEDAESVKAAMVKSWVYELSKDKISARSINRKRTSLNTFYKFLRRTEELKINPVSSVSSLKTEKRLAKFVPEDNIQKVLDNPSKKKVIEGKEVIEPIDLDTFSGSRDLLILEMLYGTGIRLSELVGLKEKDVNLKERTIKVLGKRNKERIIPIPGGLAGAIEKYLAFREQTGFEAERLILTDKGQPIYPVFVQRLVKEVLETDKGITLSKLHPHLLRHTYATHLLNNNAEIGAIKELLGHASLAATQIYTHNSIERLKGIYDQAHPRGKPKGPEDFK
jgi:integrase/recombinase XerC